MITLAFLDADCRMQVMLTQASKDRYVCTVLGNRGPLTVDSRTAPLDSVS